MPEITHAELVTTLAKSGKAILSELNPQRCHNLHMSQGIMTEAGELGDAIKKQCFYNKPLDLENVIEELGDLEFYMEGLRQSLQISREETLNANVRKLKTRYDGLKFSNEAAHRRADKE